MQRAVETFQMHMKELALISSEKFPSWGDKKYVSNYRKCCQHSYKSISDIFIGKSEELDKLNFIIIWKCPKIKCSVIYLNT